jgi:hypothetical protein
MGIFLDSGAFSAFTQKKEICIEDYISFIKKNKNNLEVCASLDVIGDAERTKENTLFMKKNGIENVLPAFHMGENLKYLKWMIDNFGYIALGGVAGAHLKVRMRFLDECWNNLVDSKGHPLLKVHGFGVTDVNLMTRYPWYSVDSTSWFRHGILGVIEVPSWDVRNKKYNFFKTIRISANIMRGMSYGVKKHVISYLESLGLKEEDIVDKKTLFNYENRMKVGANTMLSLQSEINNRDIVYKKKNTW